MRGSLYVFLVIVLLLNSKCKRNFGFSEKRLTHVQMVLLLPDYYTDESVDTISGDFHRSFHTRYTFTGNEKQTLNISKFYSAKVGLTDDQKINNSLQMRVADQNERDSTTIWIEKKVVTNEEGRQVVYLHFISKGINRIYSVFHNDKVYYTIDFSVPTSIPDSERYADDVKTVISNFRFEAP